MGGPLSSRTTDDALRRLLDEGRVRAAAIDADHARLWEALASATEGGKRFRPALLTATHDALGGISTFAALEVGAAVELLHTAFVIHDDVIDGDHVRRGRPNVSGTFRALALGDGAGASEADGYGRTAGDPGRRPRPHDGDPRGRHVRRPGRRGAPAARPLRRRPAHDRGGRARRRTPHPRPGAGLAGRERGDGGQQDGRLLLRAAPAGRCRARRRRRGHRRPSGRGRSGAGDRLPARGRPDRRLRRLLARPGRARPATCARASRRRSWSTRDPPASGSRSAATSVATSPTRSWPRSVACSPRPVPAASSRSSPRRSSPPPDRSSTGSGSRSTSSTP